MSFMGGEGAVWSDRFWGGKNQITGVRYKMQQEQIAKAGVETSGLMRIRAARAQRALEGRLSRQRSTDLAAQRASQIRMGNVALMARPRAGGSVLGGFGR
jgi:hypothetical protein